MAKANRRGSLARFFRRAGLLLITAAVLALLAAYTLVGTVLTGPSHIARDRLTRTLMGTSATDWIPGLYLEDALISQICE